MCIATRCTSVDQFVAMFHRFVDEDSFFVSTVNTRPPGLETSFSVQLADGTPVLRGLCTVLQAWTTASSPFKTPGVRLGIKRLTANSMPVFERLLVTRSTPQAPPPAPNAALAAGTSVPGAPVAAQATAVLEAPKFSDTVPTKIAARTNGVSTAASSTETDASPEIVVEQRTPGSDLILPANPLQNLTDASLEGYVDCTLYEETTTFFAVDDDGAPIEELVPPPAPPTFAPRPVGRVSTPVEIVSEPAMLDDATIDTAVESAAESMIAPPRRIAPTPPPMPVVRADATPIPTPVAASTDATPPPARPRESLPPTRESTPSGEIVIVSPAPRRRRGVLAAAGVLAIAGGLAAWISMRGGDEPDTVTPTPAAKPTPQLAPTQTPAPTADVEPTPTPTPTPTPPTTPDDEEPEMAPDTDGVSPTAGEGPCKLVVASTPAGSIVLLDGKPIAPSPITIATTCDRHKVDIRHPRYQLGTKLVALKEGTPGSVEITLQRPTHAVKVTSQPSGATIFINGNRAGTTPTVLNVLGFSNLKLEVKKTGYAPVTQKLYSKVPQDAVTVKLTKW